ncbi:MAG: hypothetical protein V2A54_09610 [Bacteroidota bacterium]
MKNIFFTIFTLIFSQGFASAPAEFVLDGNYYGDNLYIKNNYSESAKTYAIVEVLVNGKKITNNTNAHAFEVAFADMGIQVGDPVSVKIKYNGEKKPYVINPEVLKPKGGCTFSAQPKIDKNRALIWSTKNENYALPFIIEQNKWNKWVTVGEVMGTGKSGENKYSYQPVYTSGMNIYRVRQSSPRGDEYLSAEAKFKSVIPEITAAVDKSGNTINLSAETNFELFNQAGEMISSGKALNVDISKLEKNKIYWLSYDNKTIQFVKK